MQRLLDRLSHTPVAVHDAACNLIVANQPYDALMGETTSWIDHPDVGLIALDCDALIVAGDDLRITVYTAEPGTEDAERLALAVVLGTQALIDRA